MGIMRFIDLCITIVVLFILFMISRIFFLPDSNTSPGKLPPEEVTGSVWRVSLTLFFIIFKWIVIIIFAIWVFWHILKLIPIIGQIIIAVVPPFRQLEKAGIFRLYDDLFVNILKLNIIGIFRALLRFYKTAGQYVFQRVTGISIKKTKAKIVKDVNDAATPTSSVPPEDQGPYKPSPAEKEQNSTPPGTTDATDESKFTAAQHKAVEDKLQLCISERTLPIYSSMTEMEKTQTRVSNNNVSITCKAESINDYMKMKNFS